MSDDLMKRYDPDRNAPVYECDDGDFVYYTDHIKCVEELEAKLAKAVEALKFHNAAVELCIGEVTPAMKEAHYHTKRTLAELTGGKDE